MTSSTRQNLLKYILLTLISTLLMLSDDFFHQFFTPANQAEFEIEYGLVLLGLNCFLWLSGSFLFVSFILSFFIIMQIMQLSFVTVTGHPLTPFDITRINSEQQEVFTAAAHAKLNDWLSLSAVILPYSLLFVLFKKYLTPQKLPLRFISMIVIVLILGSKFERATRKNMLAFMPGPTRSSLHNSINVFSFAITSTLLNSEKDIQFPKYKPYKIKTLAKQQHPKNIIIVVADSLRTDRLGVFGYDKNTTPNLKSLAQNGELQLAQGISSSVATGASIPLFLNVVAEPGNIFELEHKTANLFKLAQKRGYKTHWLSTQESKMLNGVGSHYINEIKTIEDAQLEYKLTGEKVLHTWFKDINWAEYNFVFVLMRSVHSPYADNYDQDAAFNHSTQKMTRSETYDQAIRYYDDFIHDLYKNLQQQTEQDFTLLLTSDHGQLLGENNHWGHNRLVPEVNQIPVMLLQDQKSEQELLPDPFVMSHAETGHWLLSLMGYTLENPNTIKDVHFFKGEKVYSNNPYRIIYEHDQFLQYCDTQMTSDINVTNLLSQCRKTQDKKPLQQITAR